MQYIIIYTCVIGWAKAGIVIDSIDACGVIFTVIIVTVVRIHFAQLSLEAWRAEAPVHKRKNEVKVLQSEASIE